MYPCIDIFFYLTRCCSLDCRHLCCGPCLFQWFAARGVTACPTCLIESKGQPQPNYAVRDILSVVRGCNIPTDPSENFDPSGLIHIYREKEKREGILRARREQPVDSSLSDAQGPTNNLPGHYIDTDMEVEEGFN